METAQSATGSALKTRNTVLGEGWKGARGQNAELFLTVKDLQRRSDEVERLRGRIPREVLQAAQSTPRRKRAR